MLACRLGIAFDATSLDVGVEGIGLKVSTLRDIGRLLLGIYHRYDFSTFWWFGPSQITIYS